MDHFVNTERKLICDICQFYPFRKFFNSVSSQNEVHILYHVCRYSWFVWKVAWQTKVSFIQCFFNIFKLQSPNTLTEEIPRWVSNEIMFHKLTVGCIQIFVQLSSFSRFKLPSSNKRISVTCFKLLDLTYDEEAPPFRNIGEYALEDEDRAGTQNLQ